MPLSILDYSKAQGTADWSGLRDAVAQYYASRTGAINAEYLPQKLSAEADMYRQHGNLYQAQIPGELAKSQKQQLLNAIISQMIGAQQPGMLQMGAISDAFVMPGGGQMQMSGLQDDLVAMQGGDAVASNPLLAGILRKEMGLEAPYHTLNSDNELLTYDPLTGRVSRQAGGRLPEEIEAAKTKGVKEEERIQDLKSKTLAAYMAEDSKQPILKGLMDVVNDPRFMQATGKYQNIIQSIKPDANVQELIGEFDLYTGELVNRASSVFGTSLTQGMYNTMRNIKASKSQEPMANRAKVLLANTLSREELQYQRNLYNNLEKGLDPISASEQARGSIDTSELKDLLRTENKAHQLSKKLKVDYEQIMRNAYRVAEQLNMPVSEVLNNFEKDVK